ncbi:MAG: ArnT family glycosyltransferase, partial [Planctomycetota bacterium]
MDKPSDKYKVICVYVALALSTLVVYWQVRNYDFVNFDDPHYVHKNPIVQSGITLDSIKWAFTTGHAANWHPLTWLSHMLDCQLFGTNPGWHHLTNLLLHIANTLLLFAVLKRMTGTLWRSAFVAALFALHPCHVESVAWISERKDVLSTLFWLLTMAAYVRYVNRPRISSYLLTLLTFALGLMAKPMLVTLPFVLLLLDYWPLGRFQDRPPVEHAPQPP